MQARRPDSAVLTGVGSNRSDSGLTEDQFRADLDTGLEAAEDRLLAEAGDTQASESRFDFGEQELFAGLDGNDVARLEAAARRVGFRTGDAVIRKGGPADRLYLPARDSVAVRVPLGGGRSGAGSAWRIRYRAARVFAKLCPR